MTKKEKKAPRILIVCDEYVLQQELAEVIRKAGFAVAPDLDDERLKDGPCTGPDGLKTLKRALPDLIILNSTLEPRGMDEGLCFLRAKRKKEKIKDIPVIFFSDIHTEEELEQYKNEFTDVKKVMTSSERDGKKPITTVFIKAIKKILAAK
ncbi:MAG: hypothetical protein PHT40_03450 [Patescibacteria group bacterium]|nr:hypothetical protein [Patescibacteria group bacterium]